ncbi:MAG: hypothetical protein MI806_07380 [Minwuiales bacterium]|nr:hypothetical protein [Minwuiales bacterium]
MTDKPVTDQEMEDSLKQLENAIKALPLGKPSTRSHVAGVKTSEAGAAAAVLAVLTLKEQLGLELTDVQTIVIGVVGCLYVLCRTAAKIAGIWKG